MLNLGAPFDVYGEDWRVVSHTVNLPPNEGAFVSLLLERRLEYCGELSAWDGFLGWLSQAQWGTVPAWFGGLSLLLAIILFMRDRRRDDRAQIDKTAMWVTSSYEQNIYDDREVPPDEPIILMIFAKNSNDVPVQITYAMISVETRWLVPDGAMVKTDTPGIDSSGLVHNGFLLAPGEEREVPEFELDVDHHAPTGATGLSPYDGVQVRITSFCAADNAGRRWKVEPGRGRRARRIRRYHQLWKVFPPLPQRHGRLTNAIRRWTRCGAQRR